MNDHYADPLREAVALGRQRALQLAPVAVTTTQVLLQLKAQRVRAQAERERQAADALRARQRAEHRAARLQWLPANDPAWLRKADLLQVSRAWGAAAPYAASDPAAERAQLKCEERLRELHPYAMNRYDRLRAEGHAPEAAMREVAPMFAREPRPRTGYPAAVRRQLSPAVQLAHQDFPHTIDKVVKACAGTTAVAVPGPKRTGTPARNRQK
ncbi:hypothetical protein Pth03_44400 [Planotetraspora thailandica]|uniref:Uncharacterized protein n=1 Tax=Planotetraspora thailandica TaxID=487172 RepID=A0A8J3V3D9_9ACTN|nr:hypothetical protein [Planotetraspora thailandica]GII56051.1 hypothetical protein Pth03_44400 [Planotetraspora thailandica]